MEYVFLAQHYVHLKEVEKDMQMHIRMLEGMNESSAHKDPDFSTDSNYHVLVKLKAANIEFEAWTDIDINSEPDETEVRQSTINVRDFIEHLEENDRTGANIEGRVRAIRAHLDSFRNELVPEIGREYNIPMAQYIAARFSYLMEDEPHGQGHGRGRGHGRGQARLQGRPRSQGRRHR